MFAGRWTKCGIAVLLVTLPTLRVANAAFAGPSTLTFDTFPRQPWRVEGTANRAEVGGGVLTIVTDPGQAWVLANVDTRNIWAQGVDNDLGWTVDARLQVAEGSEGTCDGGGPVAIAADDGTQRVHLGFSTTGVCLAYTGLPEAPLVTTVWHDYRLRVQGQRVVVTADGRTIIDAQVPRISDGVVRLAFGQPDGWHAASQWDSFAFDATAACTVVGTPNAETIQGTDGDDVICALGGNDVIDGHKGNDRIYGGPGNDSLRGSLGNDRLAGGPGADVLIGNAGRDALFGGADDDSFRADAVPDGADLVVGDTGWDTATYAARTAPIRVIVDGGPADDGAPGEGDDVALDVERVIGGSGGDDLRHRGLGPSTLFGGPGNDQLDTRDAQESADDRIDGGPGTDTCLGESATTFLSCP
jgi:hypothetical protein